MANRGKNEGTIYKRADGRWEARMSLEGGRRKSHYAKTRQEAARWLSAMLRDRDVGLSVGQDERQTLQQYLTQWLEDIEQRVRPRTHQRYAEQVRLHIVPVLGKVPLVRVSAQQLEGLYSTKLREGLAPATVARMHAVLHRALGDATRLAIVPRNVASLAKAPSARKAQKEMRVLSPGQARVLLEAVRDDHLEALYVLALTTGMRRGELLALHWADVNLSEPSLQVRYTVQHIKGGAYIFTPPKTSLSRRKIALTPLAVDALMRHRDRQALDRDAAGPAWHDEDLVFTDPVGRAIRGNHILQRHFAPILFRAHLPAIRFHDLRHTAATLLLRQGVHPKVVQEMLGHSTIAMTLDIYSHVMPDMQAAAVGAMDSLLRQGQSD